MLNEVEYDRIGSFIRRLAFRIKAFAALRLLLIATISALIILLADIASTHLGDYFPYLPLILSAILAVSFLLVAYRLIVLAAKRFRSDELALKVETQRPEFNNYLISSVQLKEAGLARTSSQGLSDELIAELQKLTAQEVDKIDLRAICSYKGLWPQLRIALILGLALIMVLVFSPSMIVQSFSSLIHPINQIAPQNMVIKIEPTKIVALSGEPLTIKASVKGRIADELGLRIRWDSDKAFEERTMAKIEGDGLFGFTLKPTKPFKFQAYYGRYRSEEGEARIVDAPVVANVSHLIISPEYTGLGVSQIKPGGHVEALNGSQVIISARADKPITRAQLLIGGERRSDMNIEGGVELKGDFIVSRSDTYRLMVQDGNGFANKDPIVYRIKGLPDASPSIEVLQPAADMEIDEGETIRLKYLAKDDFGLKEVNLLYKESDGQEKQIAVESYGERKTLASGEYSWFITGFAERGINTVSYRLEVLDNDTIAGPKKGFSRTFYLKIRSREEKHKEITSLQKDIVDSAVNLLADHLESSDKLIKELADKTAGLRGLQSDTLDDMKKGLADLKNKADQLLAKVDESMRRLTQDQLSNYSTYLDMNALRNNLAYLRDNLISRAQSELSELAAAQETAKSMQRALQRQESITSELEKIGIFADKIDKKLHMDDLARVAKKFEDAQEKIFDKMNELMRDPQKSELLDAVAQELDKIQGLLKSIAEALASLPSQLPEEFLNSEALKTIDFNKMLQAINNMKERLKAGDIAGAKAELEKLISSLSQMLAALQSATRMAEMDFNQAMGGAGGSAQSELQLLAQAQSELLKRTRAIEKNVLQQIEDRLQSVIERIGDISKQRIAELSANFIKIFETLNDLSSDVPPELANKINQLLNSMGQGIKEGELKDYMAWSKMLRDYLKMTFDAAKGLDTQDDEDLDKDELLTRLEASLAITDRLMEDLSGLNVSERDFLSDEEKKAMGEMAQKEQQLKERTSALQEKLAEISKIFPFIPAELVQNLLEASEFMAGASGELAHLSPKGAVPPESEALDRLMKSQESLQQAMQQMAQRGSSVGASPIPIMVRSGVLPGMPLIPELMQPGVDKSSFGRMGASIEDFKIPGKEEYKVPKMFREEIMDSLKEGIPEGYKEQVEKYFKEIAE